MALESVSDDVATTSGWANNPADYDFVWQRTAQSTTWTPESCAAAPDSAFGTFQTHGINPSDVTVTTTDNIAPADLDGQVMLLAGATEIPNDIADQRRNGNTLRARVQDGAFAFEMVPPGNYLAVLSIRGRERSTTQVTATIGQRVKIAMPVGAAAAAPAGTPNGNGTNPGQAGFDANAPRRGRSGGTGASNANAPRQGSPQDAGGQRRPRRGN